MKLDMAESLCCSYLRHVKQCWVVQSNWKVSEHWDKNESDQELEQLFTSMRGLFDTDGSVFKKTTGAGQFLKQGEIDVVGVDQKGNVHAIDIAFHEAGLNYGDTQARVLKKLLRMVVILKAYLPKQAALNIYFVSPKVHPAALRPLNQVFQKLRTAYPDFQWHLFTNEEFASHIVQPTLEKAESVADTAELFVRAHKLLKLAEVQTSKNAFPTSVRRTVSSEPSKPTSEKLQPLVQELMVTLLERHPTLLDDADRQKMMDKEECKRALGLRIGNHPLLRVKEAGRGIGGHDRYYSKVYGDKFHVCSQWWQADHLHNARSLERFVAALIQKRAGHHGIDALKGHLAALQSFVG